MSDATTKHPLIGQIYITSTYQNKKYRIGYYSFYQTTQRKIRNYLLLKPQK
jgi:hypothetical protein